jgi:hypothetical protein
MENIGRYNESLQSAGALEESKAINIDNLLKERDLDLIASTIVDDTLRDTDILRKDLLDRFLDYVIFKISTGMPYIIHQAYPTKRVIDKELETKLMQLINEKLYPEIVLKLLKYFTRNNHDSDTNLYLAFMINSEDIIRAIYDTYLLFKNDIFVSDPDKRTMNVKRIQQVSPRTENKVASPLDAACRFKYILEFIALKQRVDHIYTMSDLLLTDVNRT